jgi:hypothetical protein
VIRKLTFTMSVPKGSRAALSRVLRSRRRYSSTIIVMRSKDHVTFELKPRGARAFIQGLQKGYSR